MGGFLPLLFQPPLRCPAVLTLKCPPLRTGHRWLIDSDYNSECERLLSNSGPSRQGGGELSLMARRQRAGWTYSICVHVTGPLVRKTWRRPASASSFGAPSSRVCRTRVSLCETEATHFLASVWYTNDAAPLVLRPCSDEIGVRDVGEGGWMAWTAGCVRSAPRRFRSPKNGARALRHPTWTEERRLGRGAKADARPGDVQIPRLPGLARAVNGTPTRRAAVLVALWQRPCAAVAGYRRASHRSHRTACVWTFPQMRHLRSRT